MGYTKDYPEVPDWVEKPEGYQAGAKVKYKGNIFHANFWATEPGKGSADENGWRFYDELYDQTSSKQSDRTKVIGYIPVWKRHQSFDYSRDELYRYITHGILSFLMFDENRSGQLHTSSLEDVEAVVDDVVRHGHRYDTKIMIALGGAVDYGFLYLMQRIGENPSSKALDVAVENVVDFVNKHDLDGVDLDLECWWDRNGNPINDQGGRLSSDVTHAAGRGLAVFARSLRRRFREKTISAAFFATSWYGNNYPLIDSLDWIGVMTYDLTGSWNNSPVGPHTSLFKIRNQETYAEEQQGRWPSANPAQPTDSSQAMLDNPILSVEDSLWYWTNPLYVNWQGKGQGLSRDKLVVGVPLYGYDFAYEKDIDENGNKAPGYKTIPYNEILKRFSNAHKAKGSNVKVQGNTSRPSFLSEQGGNYPYKHNIYFETPTSAVRKASFIQEVGAQGVIIWELTNENWDDDKSIVKALYRNSGNPEKKAKPRDMSSISLTDWMKDIPSSRSLASMTIPGTHQSVSMHGGPLVICQDKDLASQLNLGIRAFDIRCRQLEDRFTMHHGVFYQHLNFEDVVSECESFLKSHRSECIIMSVKKECNGGAFGCTDEYNTEDFDETFKRYMKGRENLWYTETKIPTLGEVRGKIVLIRRFPTKTLGIPFGKTGDTVQDEYDVPTLLHINQKWDHVRNHLEKASTSNDRKLFLNFTSGSSALAYPDAVASSINLKLHQHLSSQEPGRFGVILMDFPNRVFVPGEPHPPNPTVVPPAPVVPAIPGKHLPDDTLSRQIISLNE